MSSKLATWRIKTRQQHRAQATRPKALGALQSTALTVAVSLAVTAIFGDLIVKRNIDKYLQQEERFRSSIAKAKNEFRELKDKLETRIRERRRLSQMLTRYAASNSYRDFAETYHDYDRMKDEWSEKLPSTANQIVRMSGCQGISSTHADEMAAMKQKFQDMVARANRVFDGKNVDLVSEKEISHVLNKEFCPTYFLTLKRDSHSVNRREPISVHEHFLSQNKILYNYRINEYTDCEIRFISVKERVIEKCFANSEVSEFRQCVNSAHKYLGKENKCDLFDGERSRRRLIRNDDFDKFDYRWYLGKEFLKIFEERYVISECEKSKGFWARVMGWNCKRQYGV